MKMQVIFMLFAISLFSCESGTDSSSSSVEDRLAVSHSKEEQATTLERDKPDDFKATEDAPAFYRTVSLYGGKLTVSVPASFTEMSADKIVVKYPNAGNRPNVVYTNERASVNVAFTQVEMPTEQEDIPEVEEVLSQQLQATKPMNFKSRIEKINGSDYAIFEFESQAIDSKIYNLIFATDVNGKLLMGTFNCTEGLKGEWQSKAKEILSSLRKG